MTAQSAREVALKCLLAGEKQSAWSDGYLRNALRQAGLSGRDAALCTQLAFGVLQNRILLDWHIARLSSVPVEKLEPVVRDCLRLGVYQLLFLDRVPVHAAVNESVSLAKKSSRNPRAAGLVNAVLRAFDRAQKAGLPQPEELWIRYSHPQWLVKEFLQIFSEPEVAALLEADNGQPATCVQINTCRTTTEAVKKALLGEGVEAVRHPWLPDCLLLEGTGDISRLKAFQNGDFYVQDAAARLAVMAADPQAGMKVLDACAAPGGKSFAAAIAMDCKGNILSCDIHPHKQKLIVAGAKRLGIDCIRTAVMDGKQFEPDLAEDFDLVIADVPCSGLGIIRKKPDIRYKDPEQLRGLPEVQSAILDNVSRYVKPGGTLLYATCTLLKWENEAVIGAFLDRNNRFTLEPFQLPGPIGRAEKGMLTLWPHIHNTDGFFIAKLRRKG